MDKRRIVIYTILFIIAVAIETQGFTEVGFDGPLVPTAFLFFIW